MKMKAHEKIHPVCTSSNYEVNITVYEQISKTEQRQVETVQYKF